MGWIAAHTSPSKEIAAAEWLRSHGVDVCCLTVKSLLRRRIPRSERFSISDVMLPIFPCYLFAKVSSAVFNLMRDPPTKVGRMRVVSSGRIPIEVPDEIVGSLIEAYSQGKSKVDVIGLKAGDKVRLDVVGGIVVEVASIDRIEKYREVSVWLDMLGVRKSKVFPLELIGTV